MTENCFSIFKKAIENSIINPDPYYYAAAKEAIEEEESKRKEQLDQMNKEWSINNPSYSIEDLKKEIESLEIRKNELRKLIEEIEKRPVINLNEIRSRTKSKEDKLPRTLRAGWK